MKTKDGKIYCHSDDCEALVQCRMWNPSGGGWIYYCDRCGDWAQKVYGNLGVGARFEQCKPKDHETVIISDQLERASEVALEIITDVKEQIAKQPEDIRGLIMAVLIAGFNTILEEENEK